MSCYPVNIFENDLSTWYLLCYTNLVQLLLFSKFVICKVCCS